jgi:glyoxylase-like metal-dependent hydrolase (beta-lactamase superfamily II)
MHNRRSFLREVLGTVWTTATVLEQAVFRAAHARAEARTAPDDLFDLEKVAEGVYAVIPRPLGLIHSNAAVFENSADVLVVDTHSTSAAAASVVAQVRRQITTKPVRYIVNTHFHWDHVQGNAAYRKIAPGADIISSTVTRQLIAEQGPARAKASLEQVPKAIEDYRQRLSAAKSAPERAYYQTMISGSQAYLAELKSLAFELPNITFATDLVIHDKAHQFHLAFRGRGHTAGDIVVYCPQKKVVAAGDLLHGFLPYFDDGYPQEWPATLRSCGDFAFERVIGGHGGVQHTRERLPQMAAYISELVEAVAKGKQAGRTVQQLQETITPATLKSLGSGGYGRYVGATLVKYYPEATQRTPAEALASGVRGNVASVFNTLGKS